MKPPELPAMLLGSVDMSPLEVAGLYHTIAAEGVYTPLHAIREVLAADDELAVGGEQTEVRAEVVVRGHRADDEVELTSGSLQYIGNPSTLVKYMKRMRV